MARRAKATVDYFPHSCTHGKTIIILQQSFGLEGYAVWFKLLEQLGKTVNHFIDCRDDSTWLYLIAEMCVSEDRLIEILDLCSRLNAIDQTLWSRKVIASENFINNIKDAYTKRTINPVTIAIITEGTSDESISGVMNPQSGDIKHQSKVKKIKEEDIIVNIAPPNIDDLLGTIVIPPPKKQRAGTNVPPTMEQVKQYCIDSKKDIDYEKFWNFYESKGWLVGKVKMKNWHCSVGGWASNNSSNTNNPNGLKVGKETGFSSYED